MSPIGGWVRMIVTLLPAAVVAHSSVATVTSSDGGLPNECAAPKPEWIWCDDFDEDRLASYFEVDPAKGSIARVAGVGNGGSSGIRTRFAKGQVSAGSLKLAFGRTPAPYFRPVDGGTADYRDLYWRFYVRNQPGWTGGGGHKLSRMTVFATESWAQAMIAHVWSAQAPNQNYLLLDPASGTDPQGNLRTTVYNDFAKIRWLGALRGSTALFDGSHVGAWYCVESRVRLNDAGQSSGVFELWLNGGLQARAGRLNWLGSYASYGLNAVVLENYWNGGSPAAQERFFDNFVVSTQRIGC